MTPPWDFLYTPPFAGPENMAYDEAMLDLARTQHRHIIRVYSWERPTVSFGRNQEVQGVYDLDLAGKMGVGFVRRLTGGRALVHGQEVTYSVALPAEQGVRPRKLYLDINLMLRLALAKLGLTVSSTDEKTPTPPPAAGVCFSEPSAGELSWNGRKLVGSAQVRVRDALLQHGSLLVRDNQGLLSQLTHGSIPAPPPAATLAEALGRAVTPEEFATAARAAVRELWGPDLRVLDQRSELEELAAPLVSRYRSDQWTWGATY